MQFHVDPKKKLLWILLLEVLAHIKCIFSLPSIPPEHARLPICSWFLCLLVAVCGISVSIGFRFSYVFCEAPGNILATMMLRNQLKAFSCLEVLIVKTERISSCFCLYNCHIRSGNYATLVTTQLIIAATHMVIFPFPLSHFCLTSLTFLNFWLLSFSFLWLGGAGNSWHGRLVYDWEHCREEQHRVQTHCKSDFFFNFGCLFVLGRSV